MPEPSAAPPDAFPRPGKPLAVAILGYAMYLWAGVMLLMAVSSAAKGGTVAAVFILLLLSSFSAFLGYSWLQGGKWAWYAAVVLWSVFFVLAFLATLARPVYEVPAAVLAVSLYFGARRRSRLYFGVSR